VHVKVVEPGIALAESVPATIQDSHAGDVGKRLRVARQVAEEGVAVGEDGGVPLAHDRPGLRAEEAAVVGLGQLVGGQVRFVQEADAEADGGGGEVGFGWMR
jgi:hypothetical protein